MYLYVCVAETLAQAIRVDNEIKGFRLPYPSGTEQTKVSQYADDGLLFVAYKHHCKSIEKIHSTFGLYQKASGSKLNTSKSKAYVVGGDNAQVAADFNQRNPNAPFKLEPIGNGLNSLGIWFLEDPKKFHQTNFKILVKKTAQKTAFLSLRNITIKGKAIALITFVLSKLWYVATTVPLCNYNGNPLYRDIPMITELQKVIYSYIWNNKLELINRETLALPIYKGGLAIPHIGKKSNALRVKQINQMLQPDCKLPSTKFARYWMAKYLWRGLPWTRFIQNYQHFTGDPPPKTNKGYNSLIVTFQQNKPIFKSPQDLPTSKTIYSKYQASIDTPIGEWRWNGRHSHPLQYGKMDGKHSTQIASK